MKNNRPRYLLVNFERAEQTETADEDDVMDISNRFIEQNRETYETLARERPNPNSL